MFVHSNNFHLFSQVAKQFKGQTGLQRIVWNKEENRAIKEPNTPELHYVQGPTKSLSTTMQIGASGKTVQKKGTISLDTIHP